MSVAFLGDSNFRDLFAANKEKIEAEAGVTVEFVQTSSVASVKTYLENEVNNDIIFIGCPMNEISMKSKNNTKSREGIVESVIKDLYTHVSNSGQKRENGLFIICQPFLRCDPPWIETKMKFIEEFIKKTHNELTSNNIHLGSVFEIEAEDLKTDTIHLNQKGLEKLQKTVTNDLKIAKAELEILRKGGVGDDSMEAEDAGTPVNEVRPEVDARNLRKTPARRKRPHEESGEDSGRGKSKKKKETGIEAVLDKLDLMMEKMNGEKVTTQARFDQLEVRLEETMNSQTSLKKEVEKIVMGDNCFSASMREDLDAVENLNSRDTIIVKKLSSTVEIPNDKKELSGLVVSTAREILNLILGSDKGMKFASPLYYSNNRRVPREDQRKEFPPFKITFKLLSDSLDFKEKAIAASKDPQHRLHKAYFAHHQAIGTRIRLTILWAIADVLKKDKKDSWVTQSNPKPCLMVKDGGPLVRTYSYLEAVTTYGEKVDKKNLDEATRLAQRFFFGQVEKVFVILKD